MLPQPAVLALDERRQDALLGHLTGSEGGEGHVDEGRVVVGAHPLERLEQPELGGHETLIPWRVAIGALGSEACHRAVDQPWVVDRQILVPQPEGGEFARLVGLDEDIGPPGQTSEVLTVGVIAEIEHDAPLPAPPERIGRVAPDHRAPGRLHLDHVSAEVGEELTDLRANAIG